jgi:hypothetical protein
MRVLTFLLICEAGIFCSLGQAQATKSLSGPELIEAKEPMRSHKADISKSITENILSRIDGRLVQEMKRAWHAAGAGVGDEESVLLIFRMVDDSIQARRQPISNEHKAFIFEWHPSAIAILHTHPNSVDPRPSRTDRRVAERLGVPIFTLTIDGMYMYDPQTKKVTLIHYGLDWLEPSRWKAKWPH